MKILVFASIHGFFFLKVNTGSLSVHYQDLDTYNALLE